jgi:pectate lyase
MTRRLGFGSPWVACALSLLTLGACGQTADTQNDDGSMGAQGGTGTPGGGTSPVGGVGGTSGASGAGAVPNGGVSGSVTGGASGTPATGGASPTGGAAPGGQGGASGAPIGGVAGAPGGAPTGGAGVGGMAAGMGGAGGGAGKGGAGAGGSAGMAACPLVPVGWAALPGGGFNAPTSGGCNAAPVTVTTLAELNTALTGFQNKVVRLNGTVTGTINLTANTTLEGMSGARINGAVVIDGDINVIIRNLTIVGNNCTDASPCENGADAVSINGGSHHVWVDHCDISNGSDGNLDVVDAGDFVTVSWTKFSYSGTSRDHRFSNLIGDGDGESADAGKLGVTFHHCWWADRIEERMPRVRYGRVHLFNNLWTASGNDQTVQVGYNANVRLENNVFIGVTNPINSSDYNPNSAAVTSSGNVYTSTSGSTANRGTAWTPSSIAGYMYTLEPASGVEAAVRAGARPQ